LIKIRLAAFIQDYFTLGGFFGMNPAIYSAVRDRKMNTLFNYPLSRCGPRHVWCPTPHRKAARIGTRSTQEKINVLARRIRAEAEQNRKAD
jgi:hypothetical protein